MLETMTKFGAIIFKVRVILIIVTHAKISMGRVTVLDVHLHVMI